MAHLRPLTKLIEAAWVPVEDMVTIRSVCHKLRNCCAGLISYSGGFPIFALK